ncbi:hypothetical protein NMS_1750 [Nonlabens marinus S1-08]|uniref:Uncharacterized protein n=2 Tax=Nonlabens TaxID=363408 RepID=W8VQM8_9FLAO|nr:hypothetical protein NMS_1750 [Nonlabens marinus S1-08]
MNSLQQKSFVLSHESSRRERELSFVLHPLNFELDHNLDKRLAPSSLRSDVADVRRMTLWFLILGSRQKQ